MRTAFMVLSLFAAGCEKDLLAGADAGTDAAVDASPYCSAPATDAHAPARYKLWLAFDGIMLTRCGDSNAPASCSDIVPTDTTFPPFMDGDPARDGYIAQITSHVREAFAPYSLDVVTTRPTTTPYYLTVIGGKPALLGWDDTVGSSAPHACNAENRNMVSLVFDAGPEAATTYYASHILSNQVMMLGLPATTGPMNDCACRYLVWDPDSVCTFGVGSPIDPGPHGCSLTGTADEPAMLRAALGCR